MKNSPSELTIRVSGARGMGKTTLINLIIDKLAKTEKPIVINHYADDHIIVIKGWKNESNI
jgi:uridine kinase